MANLGSFAVFGNGGRKQILSFKTLQACPKNKCRAAFFDPLDLEISNSFTSNWNKETVFGRMDSIPAFQGVQRTITVSWTIALTGNDKDARRKIRHLNTLHQMIYPTYSSRAEKTAGGGVYKATTISTAPLMRMRLPIMSAKAGASARGLLGFVDGSLTVQPITDMGFLSFGNSLVPKEQRVSLNFYVLHEHFLGFSVGGQTPARFADFPFPMVGGQGSKEDRIDTDQSPTQTQDGSIPGTGVSTQGTNFIPPRKGGDSEGSTTSTSSPSTSRDGKSTIGKSKGSQGKEKGPVRTKGNLGHQKPIPFKDVMYKPIA